MTQKQLYINDLLYAEFAEDGSGPDKFNCWELCREVYRRSGRGLPAYHEWIKELSNRDSLINKIKKTDFVISESPSFLDIVTLKLKGRLVTHMGCMIDNRRFIHISRKCGVSITDINDRKWRGRIEGTYRYIHG